MKCRQYNLKDQNVEPEQYAEYTNYVAKQKAKHRIGLERSVERGAPDLKKKTDPIREKIESVKHDPNKSPERKTAEIELLQIDLKEVMAEIDVWRTNIERVRREGPHIIPYRERCYQEPRTDYRLEISDPEIKGVVAVQISWGEGWRSVEGTGGSFEAEEGKLRIEIGKKVIGVAPGEDARPEFAKWECPIGADILVWFGE